MFCRKNKLLLRAWLLVGLFCQLSHVAKGIDYTPLLTESDKAQSRLNEANGDVIRKQDDLEYHQKIEQVNQLAARQEAFARLETEQLKRRVDLESREESDRADLERELKNDPQFNADQRDHREVLELLKKLEPKIKDSLGEDFRDLSSDMINGIRKFIISNRSFTTPELLDMLNEFVKNPNKYFEKNGVLVHSLKQEMINQLKKYVQEILLSSPELNELHLPKIDDLSLSDQETARLIVPGSLAEFKNTYASILFSKINRMILNQFKRDLQLVNLYPDDRAVVLNEVSKVAKDKDPDDLAKYVEQLRNYFLNDPLGNSVNSIDMSDALKKVVNTYRVDITLDALNKKLRNLNYPKVKYELFENFVKSILLPKNLNIEDVDPAELFKNSQEAYSGIESITAENITEIEKIITSKNITESEENLSDFDDKGFVPADDASSAGSTPDNRSFDQLERVQKKLHDIDLVIQDHSSTALEIEEAKNEAKSLELVVEGDLKKESIDQTTAEAKGRTGLLDAFVSRKNQLKALSLGLKAASLGLVGYGLYKSMSLGSAPVDTKSVSTIAEAPVSSVVTTLPRSGSLGGLTVDAPTTGVFFKEHNSIPTNYSRSWISSALSGGK